MALTGIAYRRTAFLARPFLLILKGRAGFIILDCRGALGVFLPKVRGAGVIRAGSQAIAAANAPLIIHSHDPVFADRGGLYRADRHAGRLLALHTGPGDKTPGNFRICPDLLIHHRPVNHSRGRTFSALQLMVQAEQPTHRRRSRTIAHFLCRRGFF